jgi:hypothetical protein
MGRNRELTGAQDVVKLLETEMNILTDELQTIENELSTPG